MLWGFLVFGLYSFLYFYTQSQTMQNMKCDFPAIFLITILLLGNSVVVDAQKKNIHSPTETISDSLIRKAENLVAQHQFPEVVNLLYPLLETSSFIQSAKEEKATHLLTTALLRMQNPEGFAYLSKLLDYSSKNHDRAKQAGYLTHYSDILTFTNTMYAFGLAEKATELLSNTQANTTAKIKAYQILGKNYLSQGNPDQALLPFYSALEIQKADTANNPFTEQQLYSNLSIAYNMMGRADSALKYSSKAYGILTNLDNVPPMAEAKVLGNLSRALLISGNPDSAIQLRKKVLEINKQITGNKSTQTGGSYYHLATASFAKGDFNAALEYSQKAILTNYPEADDSLHYNKMPQPITANTNVNAVLQALMLKISFFEELYKSSSDRKWIKMAAQDFKSVDTLINVLQQSVSFENLPMVIRLNNAGYDQATDIMEKYGTAYQINNIEDIYHFAVATKAKMLAYQIQSMKASRGAVPDSLKVKRAELELQLTDLKNQMHNQEGQQNTLDSLNLEHLITQTKLLATINEINKKQYLKSQPDAAADPVTLSEVRKHLADDEALVEFVDSGSEIFIFCSTTGHSFYEKVSDKKAFKDAYQNYLKGIKTGSNSLGRALSKQLIEPVYPEISEKKHFIIIPDEELFSIPFEALPVPGNNKVLIENHSITYNYSTKLWSDARHSTLPPPEVDLVAIAPGFDDESQASIAIRDDFRGADFDSYEDIFRSGERDMLAPLPFSLEELDEITSLYESAGKSTFKLERNQATEQNFRGAPSTKILHLATHGFSDTEKPERSGLFMAQGEPENYSNDGFIHLNELFALHLDADLVVLSACKSGAGKILEGEGVFALPRGFIYAGTPNLVASLWKIHDKKTKELISLFYQELLSGKEYREALRNAKLGLIARNEFPMDWAGMVLIGR